MNSHCHVDVNSYPFNSNIAHIARSLKLSKKVRSNWMEHAML